MLKKIFFAAALLLASLLNAKPVVIASIAPVEYLAKAVGGDKIEVQSLAKGDVHSYEPKPNDMKAVAKARIFIAAGLEFEEAWIPRFKKKGNVSKRLFPRFFSFSSAFSAAFSATMRLNRLN